MLGRLGSVLLLTPRTSLAPVADARLRANAGAIDTLHVIGGAGAVSDAVLAAARSAAGL